MGTGDFREETTPLVRPEIMQRVPAPPVSRPLSSWWLDVKLGFRMLARYPGLTTAGGAGIAVAVAIASGAFSVIQANFLSSALPLPEGDRIIAMGLWDTAANRPERRLQYEFHEWRRDLQTIGAVSAFRALAPSLEVRGAPPESIPVAAVTASGLELTGVRPIRGRLFTVEDEQEHAPPVLILGETAWRNRFASDPEILGRVLRLGGTEYTVAGILPAGFAFPVNHQFWIPLSPGIPPTAPGTGPEWSVFGRLAPGRTLAEAQGEMDALSRRTAGAFPSTYGSLRPRATHYSRSVLGFQGEADMAGLIAMQGLLVSLLLLVCLNTAVLVHTRTAMRQGEIALRTALGASRSRIVAQFFIEALVLSVVAAAIGLGIAAMALAEVRGAIAGLGAEVPYWLTFRLTAGGVGYAVALSVLAAVVVSVIPALQATRRTLTSSVRVVGVGGAGPGMGRTWTALIVAQVAIAVALLPPAAFSVWETGNAAVAGPGFDATSFLSARISIEDPRSGREQSQFGRSIEELLRRLRADPRVELATYARRHPGDESSARIEVRESPGEVLEVHVNRVSPDYFRGFGVPVLAGRDFRDADTAVTPDGGDAEGEDVLVSQTLASRLPGGALGSYLRYVSSNPETAPGRWYRIAGIVRDFPSGIRTEMGSEIPRLYHASPASAAQPVALAVRIRGGQASSFGPVLRQVAASVDPAFAVRDIRTLEDTLLREQWIRRLEAGVLLGSTLSVLLLSAAGIYALMAFTVSQRRREIGIRMALGASRPEIVSGIFRRAALQLAAGAGLGAALEIALERATGGALARGETMLVLASVAALLCGVGFLAALGPVRSSLNVEPAEVLRQE